MDREQILPSKHLQYVKLNTVVQSGLNIQLHNDAILFLSFESNATEDLKDHEFEQFVSLFASHARCGAEQSLEIDTRRKLNLIFGKEPSKSLTIQQVKYII